jgi:hypothetical protein
MKSRVIMKNLYLLLSLTLLMVPQRISVHNGLRPEDHTPADHRHFDSSEKLGTVFFSTSCAHSVQDSFARGVALLHSFAYEDANQQFQKVANADPQCAMAYWGQAMSLYHQLWGRPSQSDLKRGWELLQKANALWTRTPRERDYIDALAVFYRNDDTLDYEQRAAAYPPAMENVYSRYPQDHEAAAFYALALLSWQDGTAAYLANTQKAISILTQLFAQEPNHPGAAHYLIHACDNPQFASMGLAAARRYAQIAPSSPHALHMPSHIFARLGLWQDDIQSNLAALAAAKKQSSIDSELHAMEFMEYAYLQIGEEGKAKALVDELEAIPRAEIGEDSLQSYYRRRAAFPALYVLEMRHWEDALKLQPPEGADPDIQGITYWARAIAAGHLSDVAAGRAALEQLDALMEAAAKSKEPFRVGPMHRLHNEATAWLDFAEGKNNEALSLFRPIADRQDLVGKGEIELPAREMLAEILLEANHPLEALTEYEKSLHSDPNRFNAIFGAARAAELAHASDKAASYYAQLLRTSDKGAHSDRPELVRAKLLNKNNSQ